MSSSAFSSQNFRNNRLFLAVAYVFYVLLIALTATSKDYVDGDTRLKL